MGSKLVTTKISEFCVWPIKWCSFHQYLCHTLLTKLYSWMDYTSNQYLCNLWHTYYLILYSIDNSLRCLVGLLTGSNPAVQLEAAWCITNISASTHKHCMLILKYAAPYLVTYISGQSAAMQVCEEVGPLMRPWGIHPTRKKNHRFALKYTPLKHTPAQVRKVLINCKSWNVDMAITNYNSWFPLSLTYRISVAGP